MATRGGRARVFIDGDSDSLVAEIRTAERALDRFSSSSSKQTTATGRSTRATDAFTKSTRGLGGSLSSAARYAAGAAAAYISISQAKAAIDTTNELAKTTAGLSRNLGIATEESSRWAAVAKARDVDSRALTMSFTTLSRRLREARDETSSSAEAFHSLGLNQDDVAAGNKDFNEGVLRVADAFGEAEGGAKRQAAAQALLGRGYQSLLPMMSDGAKGLQEQQEWADKYGVTLDEKAVKSQMRLVDAQRESKVAMLGLQSSFAQALTPAISDAHGEFQSLARIMGSDSLSSGEKFEKVGQKVEGYADDALDAFLGIFPEIVEEAGERAPEVAGAFVEGFMEAPILGKLVLGAWLLGGRARILGAGALLGKIFGGAFSTSAATSMTTVPGMPGGRGRVPGTPLPGGGGTVYGPTRGPGLLSRALPYLGPLAIPAAAATLPMLLDELQYSNLEKFQDSSGGLDGRISEATIEQLESLKSAYDQVAGARFTAIAGKGIAVSGAPAADELHDLVDDVKDQYGTLRNAAKHMSRDQKKAWGELAKSAYEAGDITLDELNQMVRGFGKTRRDVTRETREQTRDVGRNVGGMVDQVGFALELLGNNTNKALRAFGAKSVSFSVESVGKGAFDVLGSQRGGPIPGFQTGDVVPAMLEPGEFVLNRNAVAAMGLDQVAAMNSMWPRFASGGLIQALGPYNMPPIQYDPNHAGPNSHLHLSFGSVGAAQGFAKRIAPMGWSASEAPWAGGVTVRHSDPGHYTGSAFDANTAADETQSEVAAVARLLGGAGGGIAAQRLRRIFLSGPDGPLKAMGQGAIDMPWKAAQAFIGSQMPKVTGGVNISADGAVQRTFANVAKRLSTSKTASLALGMAGFAESGMRDLGYGHSTSQGALQLLASTASGMGIDPHNEGQVASAFLTRGYFGRGGANTLASQGLPAHLVAQGVQGSAFSSGSNYAAQRGPATAWMRRYGLQRGGPVGLQRGGSTQRFTGHFRRTPEYHVVHQILRQIERNQKQIMHSGRTEKHAINAAIAAAASGQIGGALQLDSQTPVPGQLASY